MAYITYNIKIYGWLYNQCVFKVWQKSILREPALCTLLCVELNTRMSSNARSTNYTTLWILMYAYDSKYV